jgi:hypothetical protein
VDPQNFDSIGATRGQAQFQRTDAVAELIIGAERAVLRHWIETSHAPRVCSLVLGLIADVLDAGCLADSDPADWHVVRGCLDEVEQHLRLARKRYRGARSYTGIEP